MQTSLSLLSLLLVMLLSLQSFQIITRTERQIYLNELETQLTGVGVQVIERIGTSLFDISTDGGIEVTSLDSLAASIDFGGLCDYELTAGSPCKAIEQFHGKDIIIDRMGLIYNVGIDISYVRVDTLIVGSDSTFTMTPTSTKRWAKQVSVNISNPNVWVTDPTNPLVVNMGRIYSYSPF